MTRAELIEKVYQSIGAASVCWDQPQQGVFDSDRAREIAEDLLAAIDCPEVPVLLMFDNDGVMLDIDEIVAANELEESQRVRGKEQFRTYVQLRTGGSLYLKTSFAEFAAAVMEAKLRDAS